MAKLASPKTWILDLLSVPYQFCVLSYLIYKCHDGDGGDDGGGGRDIDGEVGGGGMAVMMMW